MQYLRIEDSVFLSPVGDSLAAWKAASLRADSHENQATVVVDLIPAIHRRRMSLLSKLAVQAALRLTRGASADFLIFCSRHGEMVRTQKLLTEIASGDPLSPTNFSQSVHNTAAGIYSIIAAARTPASSIASGTATFASGWLEAEGFLAEHPAASVLLIDSDDRLLADYDRYVSDRPCAYAFGLLLTAGPGARLRVDSPAEGSEASLPIGPLFLEWWLAASPQFEVYAERQRFTWDRFVES
jgi:hypothetical protein